MLKDVEAAFALLEGWLTRHPVLGFVVMGWFGGLIAVLRMYERVGIAFTWASFLARCFMKGAMGAFVALLVYFGWMAMRWSREWGYLVAGIAGVGGSDVLEALVVGLIEWGRRKAGLQPVPVPVKADEAPPEQPKP